MEGVTIASIFTNTASVVSGVVEGGLSYLNTMWANPIGQVGILMGLAGTVIAFGKGIITRRKRM